ncbi:MAG TPA: twin-arginine translocase subunit TatC [Acidimicrobiales bacterium]|nr:twin-arginine translocase subunit TatC [Acidimicrobiales bacterium]
MSTTTAAGGQMTLVEHLAELRKRLVISVLAVAVGMLIVTVFYNDVFDLLLEPYNKAFPDNDGLLQTDPLEGFGVRIKLTTYGALALAMPVLLWQVWRFISPGLYDNEKRYAVPFVASALALFGIGAWLAYWTMPKALEWLGDIGGHSLTQFYSPGKYLQLVVYMMLAFGVGFEFPVVLVFLQLAGILQPDTLRRVRRYAYVGITVVVAVITPSGDPFSMLALSVPMVVFYEISILIGRWMTRGRALQDSS